MGRQVSYVWILVSVFCILQGSWAFAKDALPETLSADFLEFLVFCTDDKGRWNAPELGDKLEPDLESDLSSETVSDSHEANHIRSDDRVKGVRQ